MALLPLLVRDLTHKHPSNILERFYDLDSDEDDFFQSPRRHLRKALSCPYSRKLLRNNSSTKVFKDKDKFQVSLDVQQFSPEEITVKTSDDNLIIVEGKHEEKQDDHGYISRQFVRKYKVPKGHDMAKCVSKLSSDGVLTIVAPKERDDGMTEIPVQYTNRPAVEVSSNNNEEKIN